MDKIEKALAAAARRYAEGLRARERETANALCVHRVLLHLGFEPRELCGLVDSGLAAMAPDLRARAARAVATQLAHMGRLARSGAPGYSLDLHIAVKRVACGLAGTTLPADETPGHRLSGSVCNNRFVPRSRRCMAGSGRGDIRAGVGKV